jgi:hypothetical protein
MQTWLDFEKKAKVQPLSTHLGFDIQNRTIQALRGGSLEFELDREAT